MTIRQLNPYLHFNGEAEAAIRLYEEALGATVEMMTRYGEAPMPVPEDHRRRIIHALLRIGGHAVMVGDGPPGMTVTPTSALHVTLEFTDWAEMAEAFARLSAGGAVTMPLQDMFWGGHMGMLRDRFGVHWMMMRMP